MYWEERFVGVGFKTGELTFKNKEKTKHATTLQTTNHCNLKLIDSRVYVKDVPKLPSDIHGLCKTVNEICCICFATRLPFFFFFLTIFHTRTFSRGQAIKDFYVHSVMCQSVSSVFPQNFNRSPSPTRREASAGTSAGVTAALLPRGPQGCPGLALHRERGRPGDEPVWTAVPCFRSAISVTARSLNKSFLTHFHTCSAH